MQPLDRLEWTDHVASPQRPPQITPVQRARGDADHKQHHAVLGLLVPQVGQVLAATGKDVDGHRGLRAVGADFGAGGGRECRDRAHQHQRGQIHRLCCDEGRAGFYFYFLLFTFLSKFSQSVLNLYP